MLLNKMSNVTQSGWLLVIIESNNTIFQLSKWVDSSIELEENILIRALQNDLAAYIMLM